MSYWPLWGKTRQPGDAGDETHALIHHMIEVGAVASEVWNGVVAQAVRGEVCRAIGSEPDETRRLIAWLACLHDLGKASPAFQVKHAQAIPSLQAAGLHVDRQGSASTHHGDIGHYVLLEELPRVVSGPPRAIRGLAGILGGHHGTWRSSPPDVANWELGGESWAKVRGELVDELAALWARPLPGRWPAGEAELNAFLAVLGGLVTMSDWLGSMAQLFPCQKGPSDLVSYLGEATQRAHDAVQRLLPGRLPAGDGEPTFQGMFPAFAPNAVQQAAIDLGERLQGPALVIIEAPTGSGKTEAALYLAELLQRRGGGAGTYVAMPTVTTSNQMHGRVTAALSQARPGLSLRPLLVHGQALWQSPPPPVAAEEGGLGAAIDPMAWFLPRKRSLLAPYGVGTVDQALLCVLPTAHFYLRLFGLAGKTVVFDEVHAYDTYMSALFERLLAWLHALGSSVIILSATLPAATRERLHTAFGGAESPRFAGPCTYPAITWRSGERSGVLSLAAPSFSREVGLRWLARDTMVDELRAALGDGGCAAVICNTVSRAQETYLALQAADLVPPDELYLFHARYPQAWRDEIEGRVLTRFGKEPRRGDERAVLVATQVVEQSLDLDFDYMVTDLAPIDLLIQRAGRLHRHARGAGERPRRLERPTLAVVRPPASDGVSEVGEDGPMYEPYVLLRTLLALEGRQGLRMPADTSQMISAVYDEGREPDLSGRPELRRALEEGRVQMERNVRAAIDEAKKRLVAGPQSRYFVGGQGEMLHDDDPAVHRSLQALTRLTEPSVQVVCLHRRGDELSTEPEGGTCLQLDSLDDGLARALARSSVAVSHRGVVFSLLAQAVPAPWARHPYLRHCRLAVFADGVCSLSEGRYSLRLTRELGLQVIKEVP